MTKKIFIETIRVFLIILFIYASLSKFLDYEKFKFQLGKSPYLSELSGIVATGLPIVEILIVILLLFRRTKIFGFYASFFIMLLFTGYIYAMLNYSYYTPCTCGGILSKMSWDTHLWFNAIVTLLILVAVLIYGDSSKKTNTRVELDQNEFALNLK